MAGREVMRDMAGIFVGLVVVAVTRRVLETRLGAEAGHGKKVFL